jgi:hypothetical protein
MTYDTDPAHWHPYHCARCGGVACGVHIKTEWATLDKVLCPTCYAKLREGC